MRSWCYGIAAAAGLLALYFVVLTLVSGWGFAREQFATYWYFVVVLAAGFGVQIGLYARLKRLVAAGHGSGAVVGVTGATSTAAMVSCCAHYLVNILPVLGAVGVVTFVAQYQIELFWIGLLFNLGGIAYVGNKVFKFRSV